MTFRFGHGFCELSVLLLLNVNFDSKIWLVKSLAYHYLLFQNENEMRLYFVQWFPYGGSSQGFYKLTKNNALPVTRNSFLGEKIVPTRPLFLRYPILRKHILLATFFRDMTKADSTMTSTPPNTDTILLSSLSYNRTLLTKH